VENVEKTLAGEYGEEVAEGLSLNLELVKTLRS